MNAKLKVRQGERGVVRVFALNMSAQEAKFLSEPGAAGQVLGVQLANPDQVEVFPISDLEDIGLEGYLEQGAGVPHAELKPDHEKLASLEGWVMVVFSKAFGGQTVEIKPAPTLDLVGAYGVEPTDWSAEPMDPVSSAKPYSAGPVQPPREARSQARRTGGAIFAVFMIAIAVMIWMVVF